MKYKYRCIECRNEAEELYRDFSVGAIKIFHCVHCGKIVDKYVEYEMMLIFLDAILHKRRAYRHLLFNEKQSVWKLLLLYLACDAYLTWDNIESNHSDSTDRVLNKEWFYAALQQDIYIMYCLSAIVWFLGCICVITLMILYDAITCDTSSSEDVSPLIERSKFMHRVLVISSYGKLLAIPAMIWGQTHSPIYLTLAQIFVLTSNMSAFHAVRDTRVRYSPVIILILLISHLLQIQARQWIVQYLYT